MAKTYRVQCAGCKRKFTAKVPHARWHSPVCKKQHQRRAAAATKAGVEPPVPEPSDPQVVDQIPAAGSLFGAIRDELVKLDVLGTVDGQIALEMARQIGTGASGTATLLRDLRAIMLSLRPAAPEGDGAPTPEPVEDEVDRLRRERAEADARAGVETRTA